MCTLAGDAYRTALPHLRRDRINLERSAEILPGDSVVYIRALDVVELLDHGIPHTVAGEISFAALGRVPRPPEKRVQFVELVHERRRGVVGIGGVHGEERRDVVCRVALGIALDFAAFLLSLAA